MPLTLSLGEKSLHIGNPAILSRLTSLLASPSALQLASDEVSGRRYYTRSEKQVLAVVKDVIHGEHGVRVSTARAHQELHKCLVILSRPALN